MVSFSHYVLHTAKTGERWDDLAYKYYGNCFKILPLIMNNSMIPVSPFLPSGEKILVPIYDNSTSDNEDLPIWKQ